MTELALGNGLATGIQLVFGGLGAGREDSWVVLWYLICWFIRWSSCSCLPFSHLLDDRCCVSTDSFTRNTFPTLFSACVATASYCNSWSLPGLCLLVFAMYLRRVIFHSWQEGKSSAEELISSYTGNFVAKQVVEWGFLRLRWLPNLLAINFKPYFVSTESIRDFNLNRMPLFFHNVCYAATVFFTFLPLK